VRGLLPVVGVVVSASAALCPGFATAQEGGALVEAPVSWLESGRLAWVASPPLVSPAESPGDPCYSVKDPSVVYHGGKWHLFCTIRGKVRTHQIEYLSFPDWDHVGQAERRVLTMHPGYFCAPQVLYFEPQERWYLICQASDKAWTPEYGAAFATTEDVSDPTSWSALAPMGLKPADGKAGLDFWVICDERKACAFFTTLDGRMWREETSLADFPHGWSEPSLAIQGDIFEAGHVYRLQGRDRYLALVEAQGGHGWRYFKAYTAGRLDGEWSPLADTRDRAFASMANVTPADPPWTDCISHGELLRAGYDQRLGVDPTDLRFVFQGVLDSDRAGKDYGAIPWRLGLLTPRGVSDAQDGTLERRAAMAERGALRYGFRYDPLQFVERDTGLQGALVRTFVFGRSQQADAKLIAARIDEALSDQQPNGCLSKNGDLSECSSRLDELVDLGVDPQRPEIAKLLEWIASVPADERGIYFVRSLCKMGRTDLPGVADYVRATAAAPDQWMGTGCPWSHAMYVQLLWEGGNVADTSSAVEHGLRWIAGRANAAGCVGYRDPWGFVRTAGWIDTPAARQVVLCEAPMLLRAQRPDGGWGDHSLEAFRALRTHGLLDELRALPPLPPDWRVVRDIPAPDGDLWTMTWGDGKLWVKDGKANEAVAVSPDDGRELARLKLPDGASTGIGWWDGALAVVQADPKRVLRIDPGTGGVLREVPIDGIVWPMSLAVVGGKLWIGDGYLFPGWVVDPDSPKIPGPDEGFDPASGNRLEPFLAGPCPNDFAVAEDGVWHQEFWVPLLIKSGKDGELLEWGEKPFGGAVGGIAWDGTHLWALDQSTRRICRIEKTG